MVAEAGGDDSSSQRHPNGCSCCDAINTEIIIVVVAEDADVTPVCMLSHILCVRLVVGACLLLRFRKCNYGGSGY